MTDPDRWLRHLSPGNSARLHLICLPHAGGAASTYFPWSRWLPAWIALAAVQYPGRENRLNDTLADDLGQLADSITAALEPLRGQSVALFGHSMGAAVAYEVAGRLEQRWPHGPERLFLSSFPPPTQLPQTTVHQRDDQGLIAELARLAPGNEALTSQPELIELMLPAIRNDYRVMETYHPSGTVLSCPVTTLIGDRDPDITPADMLGWQPFTRGSFSSRVLAGDHFYLTTQPETVVTELLREIGPAAAREDGHRR